ncbi:hypothetical protein BJY59DRAFT_464520 [Rhodotorula toruloides]
MAGGATLGPTRPKRSLASEQVCCSPSSLDDRRIFQDGATTSSASRPHPDLFTSPSTLHSPEARHPTAARTFANLQTAGQAISPFSSPTFFAVFPQPASPTLHHLSNLAYPQAARRSRRTRNDKYSRLASSTRSSFVLIPYQPQGLVDPELSLLAGTDGGTCGKTKCSSGVECWRRQRGLGGMRE